MTRFWQGSYTKVNRIWFELSRNECQCPSSIQEIFFKQKMFLYHGGLSDTRRENGVLLNPLQEIIEIEGWVLLTFFFVYTIS